MKIPMNLKLIPRSREATFVKWLQTQNLANLAKFQGYCANCPLVKFYKQKSVNSYWSVTITGIGLCWIDHGKSVERKLQEWEKSFMLAFDCAKNPRKFLEGYLQKNSKRSEERGS